LTRVRDVTIFPALASTLNADSGARTGALYVARPDLDTLLVTGPERLEWLGGVLTCDIDGIKAGGGRWSLALTKPGKILADVLVLETGREAYLGVPHTAMDRVHGALVSFLVMEDADIAAAPQMTWATLHGPLAGDAGARVAAAVGGRAEAIGLTGLGDVAVVFQRTKDADAERAATADARVVVASKDDWERLRVERQVPAYGIDMTEATSPHEASLERRCISWDKGCYLGQEAVCMQEMRGKVKRRTVLLRIDGDAPPPAGSAVTDAAGAPIGETRTSASSHVLGGPVALSVVLAASAEPGTSVFVLGHRATVIEPNR
jgi:folate-binding protein YgfZ